MTTAALALLRRQQCAANLIARGGRYTPSSKLNSAPPVRRRAPPPLPHRSVIPLSSRVTDGASAQTTLLARTGNLLRAPSGETSLRVSRVEEDASFNGALYSLKAFGIATALVVAGSAASVWGVKTYLGVTDTQEFASAIRLTILNRWPHLTSRIHRSSLSDSTTQFPSHPDPHSHSHPPSPQSASKSLDTPGYLWMEDKGSDRREAQMDKDEDWNWPAAQARLVAAYERGGVARFAEVAVRELEAELELERRKRRIGDSVEEPS